MAKDEGNKTGDSIFERIISIGDSEKIEMPYLYGKGFRLDDGWFEKRFQTGNDNKEVKFAWDKHVDLVQKAFDELKADPRIKPAGHMLVIGATGAGNIPGYIRASILTDLMGESPIKYKHPNELLLEKVNKELKCVEEEITRRQKDLAYHEGERNGLIRAKMYLEEELKKKEGED